MKDLMKLFVETVGRYPSGNVQDELRAWSANEITTLRQQLAETEEKGRVLMDMCRDLKARVTELVPDAMRYRFIRENQYWQRTEPYYDEPGYDLIGVKFERDNGFTAKAYLDFVIDKRLQKQADEAERAGGEHG